MATSGAAIVTGHARWILAKKMRVLYLFLLPAAALMLIFHYIPMYGILIAFKKYRFSDGIIGSPWNHFEHFTLLFSSPGFFRVLRNTVVISVLRILFGFPAPIVFALLLNEIVHTRYKKIVQTVSYLPTFMSWVVLSGIMIELLSPTRGAVNYLLTLVGMQPVSFLTSTALFVPILIATSLWQGVGWNAVIYLAALSSVNPELYQSAEIDGANRYHKAVHISLPSLVPVISILFILGLGGILNAGFDQVFNLYNPMVLEVADIIDTYVYRSGIQEMRYDFSTAVGLFKNVVAVVLVLGTNFIAKRYTEYAVW